MAEQSMEWISNGPHRIRVEPPDLVYFVWNGDCTTEHISTALHYCESLERPRIFVLNDLARCGLPTEEARRNMAKDKRLRLIHAIAVFNGSFTVKIALHLVLRAAPFFLGGEMIKLRFAKDEAEARAWLAGQRIQLA